MKGGYNMPRLEISDLDLHGQTTIIGMSNVFARAAADRFGGSPADYKAGPQGTLAEMQREGTASLAYVTQLKQDISEYMDSYTWKNEPDAESGGGWFVKGTENADRLGVRDDAGRVIDAINHKLAEGQTRAMAIRIKIALEKMDHGGARDVTDYIEWIMYASYEEGMRRGVDRSRKQKTMMQKLIEVIKNA